MGVNRRYDAMREAAMYCPHARGGEPHGADREGASPSIVPTPVGVNRNSTTATLTARNCPHARGGEPQVTLLSRVDD